MTQQLAANDPQPNAKVHRIYVRDASLEQPHAPTIFLEQGNLTMDSNVNASVQDLGNNVYQVNVRGTVTGTMGERKAYVAEVEQCGIFELENMTPDNVGYFLHIRAPHLLTGYLRANLSDLLARGVLPPFVLPDLDWDAIVAANQSQTKH